VQPTVLAVGFMFVYIKNTPGFYLGANYYTSKLIPVDHRDWLSRICTCLWWSSCSLPTGLCHPGVQKDPLASQSEREAPIPEYRSTYHMYTVLAPSPAGYAVLLVTCLHDCA
jgi:hypothetical protein